MAEIRINGDMTINGTLINRGGEVLIINGQVVNGNGTDKIQSFDERKTEDARNVEQISIDSTLANVKVSVSTSPKVEVHFYGQAEIDGDVNFDVHMINHELKITLKFIGNCYNSDLRLDIMVPQKTFAAITAKSSSANITLDREVSANYINVKTQSGDIRTSAAFTNASVSTISGDVELYIDTKILKKDISVKIATISGDVAAEFNHVGDIDLFVSSISGAIDNGRVDGELGRNAKVDISTISGNIWIR